MVVHETLLVKRVETKVFLKNKLGEGHRLVVYCSLSVRKFLNSISNGSTWNRIENLNYLIIGYI